MEIIKQRKSWRSYGSSPIEPKKMDILQQFLKQDFKGPFGFKPWFRLLNLSEYNEQYKGSLGSYGLIKGAELFVAGAVDNKDEALIDYGYCFESIILKITELGLGTCWIGGSFKKENLNKFFVERLGMSDSQIVPAISPVGYPLEKSSILHSAIKTMLKADQRKPWDEMFYLDRVGSLEKKQQENIPKRLKL